MQARQLVCMEVGMEVTKLWLIMLKSYFKSSKTQFQFQFELSLAQLSPSLIHELLESGLYE